VIAWGTGDQAFDAVGKQMNFAGVATSEALKDLGKGAFGAVAAIEEGRDNG